MCSTGEYNQNFHLLSDDTVAAVEIPSLWIFGGEDSSMPSGDSIRILEELRRGGRPIEIEIFPDAAHGILIFEGEGLSDRVYLGYAPGYLDLQVEWLRSQNGLITNPQKIAR